MRLVVAAALCASAGCIITEDEAGTGVTLELSWECPSDASDLGIVAYPLDADGFIDGDGVPDIFACDNAQPARFLYDVGDWYIEATPEGSREYFTLADIFTGAEMEVVELDFEFDPNYGAFYYTWEIGGANPATGCNSKDVSEVTITATVESDPGVSFDDTFPCEIGGEGAQSRPMPLDTYIISGSPDGGVESVITDGDPPEPLPFVLEDESGRLALPDPFDIAVE
jgi:hypothetical protein